MKQACACMFLIAIFQTCSAAAQDAGVYVSAAVGLIDAPDDAHLDGTPRLTGSTDNDEVSWNVAVGYRFNPNIALELGYVDLGKVEADLTDASGATDSSAHASFAADGTTLALIGTFPIGRWEPYLKAGVLFSSTDLRFAGAIDAAPFAGRLTNDNEDPLYGTGVRFAATESLRIFLDVTFFHAVGEPETGRSSYFNTSLGVLWRF